MVRKKMSELRQQKAVLEAEWERIQEVCVIYFLALLNLLKTAQKHNFLTNFG